MSEGSMAVELPTSLNYLRPLILPDLCRVGRSHDGGYVIPASAVAAADHLLSFGLSYDWSFETEFRARNRQVSIHAYDHSVTRGALLRRAATAWRTESPLDWLRIVKYTAQYVRNIQHFPERVVSRKVADHDADIETIFGRMGTKENIFLKMDIEGFEYEVLGAILAKADRLIAMVIEFHEITARRHEFEACISEALRRFDIVHLHGNNFAGLAADGLPDCLELTLVKKRAASADAPRRNALPIPLDQPCDPGRPEIALRFPRTGISCSRVMIF